VFSPVHGRRYTDADDLRQALADCLVLPVRFVDAVRQLHADRCTRFVESGALNALTRCVELTVPGVRVVAPLSSPDDEIAALRAAGQSVDQVSPNQPAPPPQPARLPAETRVTGQFVAAAPAIPTARTSRPAPTAAAQPARRSVVLDRLRELYAEALEDPADAFTEDAELEADLGIDSLKQTSLLARVVGEFDLPDRPAEMRVWDYATLGRLADHIVANQPKVSR
jgi:acyl carrier protein